MVGQQLSVRRVNFQVILTNTNSAHLVDVFLRDYVLVAFPLYTRLLVDDKMDHPGSIKVIDRQRVSVGMLTHVALNRLLLRGGMDAYVVDLGEPILQLCFEVLLIFELPAVQKASIQVIKRSFYF